MRTRVRTWRWYVAAVLAANLLATTVSADTAGVVVQKVDASQFPTVRAYVSVLATNVTPVTGLDARAFQVQEDGKPVDGLVVDAQDPIVTALVIGTGMSMADDHKLDRAKEAATAFVDTIAPGDRATVVSFASRVTLVQDYTADKSALKSAIDSLAPQGNTVLYDAVTQTVRRQAAQPERRKPVIVLTDNVDTASTASLEAAAAAASTAAVPVYTIGLGSAVNKDVLGQIASGTNGKAVFLDDPADLNATFQSIIEPLRRQYALRYTSRLTPDTATHGLAVQAAYSGQQATGLGSFIIPAPVAVAAPTAAATVAPTPAPTIAAPTPAPVASTTIAPVGLGVDNAVLIGVLLALILVVACAWFLLRSRGPAPAPVRAPAVPEAQVTRARGDMTEVVGGTLDAGVTFIKPGREKPAPQARLVIAARGEQKEILSREAVITLGRAEDKSTVFIDDPLASRAHVRIRRDGAQFSIEDLGSKNGTQLNGEPIAPEIRRPLKSNDRIAIGDTVVTFIVDSH